MDVGIKLEDCTGLDRWLKGSDFYEGKRFSGELLGNGIYFCTRFCETESSYGAIGIWFNSDVDSILECVHEFPHSPSRTFSYLNVLL